MAMELAMHLLQEVKLARKSLYVLLVGVMLVAFSVTACAPGGGDSGAAGTAAGMEDTTWRMQSPYPAGMSRYICIEAIADRLTTITEGKLTVEAHPSGSIVPAYAELEAVAAGTLEMADNSVQSGAGTLGDWAYFVSGAYPAGPSPMEFIGWYYDGGGIATLEGLVQKTYPNVTLVGMRVMSGAESFGWYNKTITSIDDFKGMKFRTSGIWGEILDSAGASVVLLPGGELYPSMERGVIDGFEFCNPGMDYDMGFCEIADYWYGPGIHATAAIQEIWVQTELWEALPDSYKVLIEEVVKAQCFEELLRTNGVDALAMDKIRDAGVQIMEVPLDVQREIVEMARKLYAEKAAADPEVKLILGSQDAYFKKIRESRPLIDPDLSQFQDIIDKYPLS